MNGNYKHYLIDVYEHNGSGNKPEKVYIIKTTDNRFVVTMHDKDKAVAVLNLLEEDYKKQ